MRTRTTLPLTVTLIGLGLSACSDTSSSNPTAPDLSATSTTAAPAVYTVQALPLPAKTFTGEARGINDAGVIAGFVQGNDFYSAVRWNPNDRVQDLGNLAGLPSDIANDLNQAGTVVGFAFGSAVSFARAFVWTRATGMLALPDLGGNANIAQAINATGTVVGWAADSFGTVHAAKWDPTGSITDLNPPGGTSIALDINDAGDIAGWTIPFGATSEHAHLWRHDGVEVDLGTLGGALSNGLGINNSLRVVGFAELRPPDPEVAFSWTPGGGMFDLGFGAHSEALAVSDPGRVVGLVNSGGVTGLTKFKGVLQILPDLAPAKGFHFSGPVNVNRCGTIVGSSVSPNPASAALLPVVWKNAACD